MTYVLYVLLFLPVAILAVVGAAIAWMIAGDIIADRRDEKETERKRKPYVLVVTERGEIRRIPLNNHAEAAQLARRLEDRRQK